MLQPMRERFSIAAAVLLMAGSTGPGATASTADPAGGAVGPAVTSTDTVPEVDRGDAAGFPWWIVAAAGGGAVLAAASRLHRSSDDEDG